MGVTAGNFNVGELMALVGVTSAGTSQVFDNHNFRGAHICLDITAMGGVTPILTLFVEGQDPASGKWYTLLASAALSLSGFNRFTIYPGVAPVSNVKVDDVIPATWRVRYTLTGVGPSASATIGACMLK